MSSGVSTFIFLLLKCMAHGGIVQIAPGPPYAFVPTYSPLNRDYDGQDDDNPIHDIIGEPYWKTTSQWPSFSTTLELVCLGSRGRGRCPPVTYPPCIGKLSIYPSLFPSLQCIGSRGRGRCPTAGPPPIAPELATTDDSAILEFYSRPLREAPNRRQRRMIRRRMRGLARNYGIRFGKK